MQIEEIGSDLDALAADFTLISDIYDGSGAADPYPLLAALRRQTPVMNGDILEEFRVPSQADYARCGRTVFTVFQYADVLKILRDPQTWLSSLNGDGFGSAVDNVLLTGMDGDTHKRFRALMSPAFAVDAAKSWNGPLVQPIIRHEYADSLRPRGRADLLLEFALPFPVRVVYAVLGFPENRDAVTKCAGWALQVMSGPQMDVEKAAAAQAASMAAAQKLFDYILGVVQERRDSGKERNDLIGSLLSAKQDGTSFTDEQIAGFLRGVLLPATETTTRTFANLLLHLFRNPAVLERIRADRSLIPKALTESMRLEPVAGHLARLAARDTDIAGTKIPAGAAVCLSVMAAQRDETVFDNPDVFDIDRPFKPIMGFGFGPHMCLGQSLARIEIEAAINAVLDFPGLELDPDYPAPVMRGMQFRGPDHLHVVWDV
jgi:cytochrome P450